MRRTVIFDLDGTLADTAGDLIASANAALGALGHAPQLLAGRDDATAFRGGRAMLALAARRLALADAEALVERGYPLLLEAYGAALNVHTRLYPGAAEAVARLREAGVATGICTNKPEGLAIRLVEALGLAPLFDALVGADTLPVRKPDPAPYLAAVERAGGVPERSFLVGDTETDRNTARAAGVPCALVTFGPDGEGVRQFGAEALLGHFDELEALVARLLP
ncbi:HAD-IA family hydrolase [Roseibacterium sp. SDUM158017]|uniref:HAD-IA family hydrolase n=1 Tax=Roseicyclus salinarum TaxID=3036773 RepID=UPI0024157C96|nr:HAD-IA family hydrolase [Roseibacterium sp. SDUM158017]MDG4648555.1 HAD-IA family hydrolase [Roseibacterium sp. SDUM158017]